MANTYSLLGSYTVGSGGASNVSFTSIPQYYTDLKIVASVRSNRAATSDELLFKLNTSTSSFTTRYMYANGATNTHSSSTYSAGYVGSIASASTGSNIFSNNELYISNYTSSNNKSFGVDAAAENNTANAYGLLISGLWSNTAPVTQIDLYPSAGTAFVQHSTFYLYGIKNS